MIMPGFVVIGVGVVVVVVGVDTKERKESVIGGKGEIV